jgi:outer membrane protein
MAKLTPIALALMFAYSAHAADLLDVYQAAEQQDQVYAAAKATYAAGLEKLPQARSALRPQLNLRLPITYNYVRSNPAGENAQTASDHYAGANLTLELSQALYRPENAIIVDQAQLQLTQIEAQLAQAQQDLIVRASQAYFDVLLAEDNVAVSRNQKIAISEQLAQAKRNFEVGTATITDTHEAQARFDLATAREIADQSDLEVKRRALEILVGKPLDQLAPLRDRVNLPAPTPNDMSQWVDVAQKQSLQVVVFKTAEEIAIKEIERNKAAFKPTVDLIANLGENYTSSDKAGFGQNTQLNYPIWEGGLRNSKVRESVALREKARFDTENARRQVAQNARQAYLGVTSGIAQVKALEQAVVSTQSQLESTKLGQEVGVRTGVDVLNAQQQLYTARRDLYSAQYNTILNQLRLKFAAGLLARNDLIEVNGTLRKPGEPTSSNVAPSRAKDGKAIIEKAGEMIDKKTEGEIKTPAAPKVKKPARKPAVRLPGAQQ